MQQQSQDTVSGVLNVIHAAYPDSWLMVAPSAEDDMFSVYSSDKEGVIITTSNPVRFVVTNRTTRELLTWGEAATAMDAFAIITKWLALPKDVERVA